MKITNETLRVLQDAEQNKVKPQAGASDFSDILNKHIEGGQNAGAVMGDTPVHGLEHQFPLSALNQNSPVSVPGMGYQAAQQMDNMFSGLEQYAQQMANGGQEGLKNAYSTLQGVSGQVAQFKNQYPNAGAEMPQMAALLNEVDVLATTETFKFNRGDYL